MQTECIYLTLIHLYWMWSDNCWTKNEWTHITGAKLSICNKFCHFH